MKQKDISQISIGDKVKLKGESKKLEVKNINPDIQGRMVLSLGDGRVMRDTSVEKVWSGSRKLL